MNGRVRDRRASTVRLPAGIEAVGRAVGDGPIRPTDRRTARWTEREEVAE